MINERAKAILDFCFIETARDQWFKKDRNFDNKLEKFFMLKSDANKFRYIESGLYFEKLSPMMNKSLVIVEFLSKIFLLWPPFTSTQYQFVSENRFIILICK